MRVALVILTLALSGCSNFPNPTENLHPRGLVSHGVYSDEPQGIDVATSKSTPEHAAQHWITATRIAKQCLPVYVPLTKDENGEIASPEDGAERCSDQELQRRLRHYVESGTNMVYAYCHRYFDAVVKWQTTNRTGLAYYQRGKTGLVAAQTIADVSARAIGITSILGDLFVGLNEDTNQLYLPSPDMASLSKLVFTKMDSRRRELLEGLESGEYTSFYSAEIALIDYGQLCTPIRLSQMLTAAVEKAADTNGSNGESGATQKEDVAGNADPLKGKSKPSAKSKTGAQQRQKQERGSEGASK